jgi:hypothetical protein
LPSEKAGSDIRIYRKLKLLTYMATVKQTNSEQVATI